MNDRRRGRRRYILPLGQLPQERFARCLDLQILPHVGGHLDDGMREEADLCAHRVEMSRGLEGERPREPRNPRVGGCVVGVTGAAKLVDLTVSGTTRALACRGRRGGRLARRFGVGRRLIGEGADEHGRGGRAPRDRAKASNSPVRGQCILADPACRYHAHRWLASSKSAK
jgi:hypothetical protein